MFDDQKHPNLYQQQRLAWFVLAMVAGAAYYVMAVKTGSWLIIDWKSYWPWR